MDRQQLANDVIRMALEAGASAAEVRVREGTEFSSSVRLGITEKLLQASFRKLGLRLFCGNRSVVSASSDFSPAALRDMVADTIALARAASSDPAAGLAPTEAYG